MWLQDHETMENLVKELGTPYAAAMYVAQKARKLQKDVYNVISESVALEWAISGKQPENLDKRIKNRMEKEKFEESDRLQDVLDVIDDDIVRVAVLNSYRASVRQKMLVYDYNGITDKYIRARVRILTKMTLVN